PRGPASVARGSWSRTGCSIASRLCSTSWSASPSPSSSASSRRVLASSSWLRGASHARTTPSAWAFSLLSFCASSWLSQKPGSRLSASISSERRRLRSTSKAPPERRQALVEVLDPFLHTAHGPSFLRGQTIDGLLPFEPAFVDPLDHPVAVDHLLVQEGADRLAEHRGGRAAAAARLLLHGLRQFGGYADGEHARPGELHLEPFQRGREPGDAVLAAIQVGADA